MNVSHLYFIYIAPNHQFALQLLHETQPLSINLQLRQENTPRKSIWRGTGETLRGRTEEGSFLQDGQSWNRSHNWSSRWNLSAGILMPFCSSDLTRLHILTHRSSFPFLTRSNVGEVQSSNYPISALTVGHITHYAPLHLSHSPSQSIYHICLSYPITFPQTSLV